MLLTEKLAFCFCLGGTQLLTEGLSLDVNIKTIFRIKIPEDATFSIFGFLPHIQ